MSFTKEDLQKISVYNLREIGRECGVKSPTSLNKGQLIQAILDIENGKVKPCYNFTNRGRPTLSTKKVSNYTQTLDVEKISKIKKIINACEEEILKIILDK